MNNLFPLIPRIRHPNGTRQDPPPSHPSRGGNPYSDEMRRMVLQMHFNGVNLRNPPPEFADLRLNHKFPCYSTCQDWIQTYHATGDICLMIATGNRHAEREISGLVLEWLALYRAVLPKATLAECRAFLFNMDPTQPPYSNSQVHRAEKLLDLKRKAASTTADFATLPINMLKRELYWTMPPPLGMVGVAVADIIDIDEAGFFLESSNRNFGKTVSCLRCSQNGVYGRGEKVNLLLAISGDDATPMRWSEMWMEGGTTIERFHTFIERILDDLDQRFPQRSFVFTMDNLAAHKNPLITNAILNAGHRYVFRAPYWPVDGAVEYVFNAIQTQLRIYFNRINDMADLRNRINLIIGGFLSFVRFFTHVGFPV